MSLFPFITYQDMSLLTDTSNGGYTLPLLSPSTKERVSMSRYVVGVTGVVIPLTVVSDVPVKMHLLGIINRLLKTVPAQGVGSWVNEGNLYLDVLTSTDSEEEAISLSRQHNQLAYYDTEQQRVVDLSN